MRLPLQRQRLDRLRHHRVAHESERRLADQHSPGAAACSKRAATLTASPVASRSAVPVTTSPVLTPIRPRDAELGQRVAHLHGRPAGPQRVVLVRSGTPNTAITASPMNFSTVPPCDSTIPFIRSK